MLRELGVPGWQTDARSSGEALIEVGGRLCYKAFGTELNKNLTRVREGNFDYIGNILKQKHGSVITHAHCSFALLNVSRILTHELVRHGTGTGFSQESGRFVRVDDIGFVPADALSATSLEGLAEYSADAFGVEDQKQWAQETSEEFDQAMDGWLKQGEKLLVHYANKLGLNNPKAPFGLKKKVTSALRRYLPNGQANNILVTANHRAWRWMVESRTSFGAEEEIRQVFYDIGVELQKRYPALYQDMNHSEANDTDIPQLTFLYSKV